MRSRSRRLDLGLLVAAGAVGEREGGQVAGQADAAGDDDVGLRAGAAEINNRPWYNRPGNWNRPWYGGVAAGAWAQPWFNHHYGWHNGFWNNWPSYPSFWYGAGTASAGWLDSGGDTYVYNNPYYTPPADTTVVVQPQLNYSAPLPAPTVEQTALAYPPEPDPSAFESGELPTTPPPAPSNGGPIVTEANKHFDAAREAFKRGDYPLAQSLAEKAIVLLPSDATLHEFRALTLFAQKKYKEAAAALYSVLAAGPGWDWKTLSGLYSDPDTYTKQLRALEEYAAKNPNSPEAHFVLAYHYLVLGSLEEAAKQFREVVRLQPEDKLSAAARRR